MKTAKFLSLALLFSQLFTFSDVISQHKFEVGVNFDPLVIPVNFGTYVESGPGFYDINGRGKITQAGSAYFNYWPFNNFGFSAGVGIRSFRSQIDYSIPNAIAGGFEPPLHERSYPFSAKGLGPTFALLWRSKRWRARIGLELFDSSNQEYTSTFRYSSFPIWKPGDEKTGRITIAEQAYWYTVPQSYEFLLMECQYYIFKNTYIKLGFETTLTNQYPDPYTLEIWGYTAENAPDEQLMNDYRMSSSLSSFSIGIGYNLGFGRYKNDYTDSGK